MESVLKKVFFLCVVIVMLDSTIPARRSREELKEELRGLFNGGGALSDFVFLELEDLQNYTKVKGLPRNRTELRRKNRPKVKERDPIENILARTQKQYSNGKNTDFISKWAKVLHTLLYNENVTKIQKRRLQTQFNTLVTQNEQILERVEKSKKDFEAMKKNLDDLFDDFDKINENDEQYDVDNAYQHTNNNDYNDEYEYNGDNDYKRKRRQLNDGEQKPNVRNRRELVDENQLALLPRSPVQTIDHERMRRSTFSYVDVGKCDEEGSNGVSQDTVLLCKTCYKTVDFGLDVIPRYANSIECDDNLPKCIDGHGTCTQKVVYYTFQKVVDTITNSWVSFEQPLNVSCECECLKGSLIHAAYVGNSN